MTALEALAAQGEDNANYKNQELITALNRIGTMLDTANQNGISGAQLTKVNEGLEDIKKAIENNSITSEDLNRIITAIDNIELKNEPNPYVIESLKGITDTLKNLEASQTKAAEDLPRNIIIVGIMISASLLAGSVIAGSMISKQSKKQTQMLLTFLKANAPLEDEDEEE